MSWSPGDVVVRREVLNDGRCWEEMDVVVVHDDAELLATYIPSGAAIRYPLGDIHPWWPKAAWEGHGVLTLQRPADMFGVWVFWRGDDREFAGWYVNFQEPFRRGPRSYDTQDLELDIWVPADGPWQWKDRELLEQRVREGRFTEEQAEATRAAAAVVAADLDAGRRWWDPGWASWSPG